MLMSIFQLSSCSAVQCSLFIHVQLQLQLPLPLQLQLQPDTGGLAAGSWQKHVLVLVAGSIAQHGVHAWIPVN